MKPINFDKIDHSTFVDAYGIKREIRIAAVNPGWIWVFPYGDDNEPNCFRFQIDWNTKTFDVLTALRGQGIKGKVFPEHTGLKLRAENYRTLDTFIKFISDWVSSNNLFLTAHISI